MEPLLQPKVTVYVTRQDILHEFLTCVELFAKQGNNIISTMEKTYSLATVGLNTFDMVQLGP